MSTQFQHDAAAGALLAAYTTKPMPPLRLDDWNFENVKGRANVFGRWDGQKFYPAYEPIKSSTTQLRWTNQLDYIKTVVMKAIKAKRRDQPSFWFMEPVDAASHNIPLYYRSIPNPAMDLKTIKARLDSLWYLSVEEAVRDFNNMFDNCIAFNALPESLPHKAAVLLRQVLHDKLQYMPSTDEEFALPTPAVVMNGKSAKKGLAKKNSKRKLVAVSSTVTSDDELSLESAAIDNESLFNGDCRALAIKQAVLGGVTAPKHVKPYVVAKKQANKIAKASSGVTTPLPVANNAGIPVNNLFNSAKSSGSNATTYNNATPTNNNNNSNNINNGAVADVLKAHGGDNIRRPKRVKPPQSDLSPDNLSAASGSAVTTNKLSTRLRYCYDFLGEFWNESNLPISSPFLAPVDVVKLNLTDYYQVVKRPMDFGTIKRRLEAGQYVAPEEFAADVRQVFSNCYKYNSLDHAVVQMAKKLQAVFELKYAHIPCIGEEMHAEQRLLIDRAALRSNPSYVIALSGGKNNISTLTASAASAAHGVSGVSKKKRKTEGIEAVKVQICQLQSQFSQIRAGRAGNAAPSKSSTPFGNFSGTTVAAKVPLPSVSKQGVKSGAKAVTASSKRSRIDGSSSSSTVDDRSLSFELSSPTSSAFPSLPSATAGSKGPQATEKRLQGVKDQAKAKPLIYQPTGDIFVDATLDINESNASPMTYEEKHALSVSIGMLPQLRVNKVAQIIKMRETATSGDDSNACEMEIDFEQLKPSTLRAMERYAKLSDGDEPPASSSIARQYPSALPEKLTRDKVDVPNGKKDGAVKKRPMEDEGGAASVESGRRTGKKQRDDNGTAVITSVPGSTSAILSPHVSVVKSVAKIAATTKTLAANEDDDPAVVQTATASAKQAPPASPPASPSRAASNDAVKNGAKPDTTVTPPDGGGQLSAAMSSAVQNTPSTAPVRSLAAALSSPFGFPAAERDTANTAAPLATAIGDAGVQQSPRKTGALDRVAASLAAGKAAQKDGGSTVPLAAPPVATTAAVEMTLPRKSLLPNATGIAGGLAAVDWKNMPINALGGVAGRNLFKEQFESHKLRQEAEAARATAEAAVAEQENRRRQQQQQQQQQQQHQQQNQQAHQQSFNNNSYRALWPTTGGHGATSAGNQPTKVLSPGAGFNSSTHGGYASHGGQHHVNSQHGSGAVGNGSLLAAATVMSPPSSDTSSATSSTAGTTTAPSATSQSERLRQRELERERRRRVAQISLDPQQSAVNDFLQEVQGARGGLGF